MQVPDDRQYSEKHVWAQLTDGAITSGITDFAQDELGDIVYLQLPDAGSTVTQGESMGEIESVKTVSELIAPVSGEVLERNAAAMDRPELVNHDPYGEGWLVRVRPSDQSGFESLLSAAEYRDRTETGQ